MNLFLFLKRKPRFSLLSFSSFSFKSLCDNYSLLKVYNHALSWRHIFTLFSHNRHDHARIRVLVNIFSIRSSSLEQIFCIVYHIRHFDFQRRSKKLYTLRKKNPTVNNPHPPSPFPISALRLLDTSPIKHFITNSGSPHTLSHWGGSNFSKRGNFKAVSSDLV